MATGGIQLIDTFRYSGKKFLDMRQGITDLTMLKSMDENSIPDGFTAYIASEDAYYQYNASYEYNEQTGRWRIIHIGREIENDEFLFAILDKENHLLFGIKADGKPYFPKNDMYHVVQNEEYLYAVVDAGNKLLIGIRSDGEIIEGKIPLKTRQEIEHVKTELSRNVLVVEMDRATGRIIGHTGNDSRIKSCVQDRVTGIITINQVIE